MNILLKFPERCKKERDLGVASSKPVLPTSRVPPRAEHPWKIFVVATGQLSARWPARRGIQRRGEGGCVVLVRTSESSGRSDNNDSKSLCRFLRFLSVCIRVASFPFPFSCCFSLCDPSSPVVAVWLCAVACAAVPGRCSA